MVVRLPKICIHCHGPHNSFVEVDGVKLQGVTAISLDYSQGNMPNVTIEMWGDVEVTGDAQASLVVCDPRNEGKS